tara:strand:- start:2689 stop:3216 length:528 start_codon:yes stop_codon:yes gene_type:complete
MSGVHPAMAEEPNPSGPDAALLALRARLVDTNINEKTLLATDYLNHFNEFVMLLELVGDMPDMLDEAREWQPKSYQDHFSDSAFSDRELAIEAYDMSPPEYRLRFDETVARINAEIDSIFARVVATVEADDTERLTVLVKDGSQTIRGLIDIAGAIINGFDDISSQSQVDQLLEN